MNMKALLVLLFVAMLALFILLIVELVDEIKKSMTNSNGLIQMEISKELSRNKELDQKWNELSRRCLLLEERLNRMQGSLNLLESSVTDLKKELPGTSMLMVEVMKLKNELTK